MAPNGSCRYALRPLETTSPIHFDERQQMRGIGSFLFIMGAGSFVLNLIGMEFKLLMWIDLWGPQIGLMIRLGLMAVGAALWFVGLKLEMGGGVSDDSSTSDTKSSEN